MFTQLRWFDFCASNSVWSLAGFAVRSRCS